MSTVILDTITGKSTATTITIGSTPVVSTSANSLTIRGEGSAQTSIQQGLNKAWCTADENSSSVIRDAFNVSTLTDNSSGNTSFNISSAMADTNFSGVGMASLEGSVGSYDVMSEISNSRTTSLIRILSVNYNNGASNESEYKMVQICGDLA